MKVGRPGYFKKFIVIFGPKEEHKLMDRFPDGRFLRIRPRTDLRPWGTREVLIEEPMLMPKKAKSKKVVKKAVKKSVRKHPAFGSRLSNR